MDLSIITGDWPYDEEEESRNVRKIVGVDGRMKIQLRIRSGLIQWEIEGRPDGRKPHGFPSILDYCVDLLARQPSLSDLPERLPGELDANLAAELADELFDYYRRSRALFNLGDYRRALDDALHNLEILELICESCLDQATVFNYDRYRPALLVDRARAQMLIHLQDGDARKALDALSRGIRDMEVFHVQYGLEDERWDSPERQILVDLRRSLREKHNVPLNDQELLHSLEVEQEIAIQRENYEMAARLRDKISLILHRIGSRK